VIVVLVLSGCGTRTEDVTGEKGGTGAQAVSDPVSGSAAQEGLPQPVSPPQRHRVLRTTDGDSLVLENGERVRLIGVDTPETRHPELPVQRFAKEASEFSKKTAEGKDVELEFGPELRDKYGRLLAYVWIGDLLLNRALIRRGYGYAMTRFPHQRMEDFLQAEKEARDRRYGMWHDSPSDGRLTNLLQRWDSLDTQGKHLLDQYWERLLTAHPAGKAAPAADKAEESRGK
jgi:endonuclease YncB( thermonuclease family)